MENKTKILVLGYCSFNEKKENLGGAHRHVFDLVNVLQRYSDLDVYVLSLSEAVDSFRVERRGNLTICCMPSLGLPKLMESTTVDQYRVIKKIRQLNPDLIHAHCTAPLFGFPASLLVDKYPVVLTVHGVVGEESKSWRGLVGLLKGFIYGWMERFALRRIKYIIAVTPYVKEKIMKYVRGEVTVIPVGVDESFFGLPNNEKPGRLLFVGGIEPRKGLIHLLEAVKILKETGNSIELYIVGRIRKRDYYAELTKYVYENNLDSVVRFLGPLSDEDLRREYGECSIFVLPSQEESLGLVLVEAMAAGKPVVATKVGGVPYVIDDNVNGFLVDYGDSKQLAEKIMLLLKNKELRRVMGQNGKKRAEDYKNAVITNKIYEFYMSISKDQKHES